MVDFNNNNPFISIVDNSGTISHIRPIGGNYRRLCFPWAMRILDITTASGFRTPSRRNLRVFWKFRDGNLSNMYASLYYAFTVMCIYILCIVVYVCIHIQ
jgi:hypothetical protein